MARAPSKPKLSPFTNKFNPYRGMVPSTAKTIIYPAESRYDGPFDTYLQSKSEKPSEGLVMEIDPTSYSMSENNDKEVDLTLTSQFLDGNGPPALNLVGSKESVR
jgi:hypothetical protein